MALTLGPWLKGFPPDAPPLAPSDIAARRWNLLAGDLPLPLAALDRDALAHNIQWMQAYARSQGVDLAPHGKTTMSPQLFQRQLDAGAWGITFANVFQLRVGVAAGVRRALIANQLVQDIELAALQALRAQHGDLRVVFLIDSLGQLSRIEAWSSAHAQAMPFEALLEIGMPGPGFAKRLTRSRWHVRCAPARQCVWSASNAMKGSVRPATPIATANTPQH
jgi:D-serine dehydratase